MSIKGGVCIFFKNALENESGQVPKQTCSQSAVRGVSTHDAEERAFISAHDGHLAELSDSRKIEMENKKQKRKTSAEQKKAYTVPTPDVTVVLSRSV